MRWFALHLCLKLHLCEDREEPREADPRSPALCWFVSCAWSLCSIKNCCRDVCAPYSNCLVLQKIKLCYWKGTGHQPPSQLEGFILIAALAIAMSSLGSRERGVRWEDCVLGLSPRDQEQQWDLPTATWAPRTGVWGTWCRLCLSCHGWVTQILERLFPLRMWWPVRRSQFLVACPDAACSAVLGGRSFPYLQSWSRCFICSRRNTLKLGGFIANCNKIHFSSLSISGDNKSLL